MRVAAAVIAIGIIAALGLWAALALLALTYAVHVFALKLEIREVCHVLTNVTASLTEAQEQLQALGIGWRSSNALAVLYEAHRALRAIYLNRRRCIAGLVCRRPARISSWRQFSAPTGRLCIRTSNHPTRRFKPSGDSRRRRR